MLKSIYTQNTLIYGKWLNWWAGFV